MVAGLDVCSCGLTGSAELVEWTKSHDKSIARAPATTTSGGEGDAFGDDEFSATDTADLAKDGSPFFSRDILLADFKSLRENTSAKPGADLCNESYRTGFSLSKAASSTATFVPRTTFPSIKDLFAETLSPCVKIRILFKIKGVTSFPLMPDFSASSNARAIISSISSFGMEFFSKIEFAKSSPEEIPRLDCASVIHRQINRAYWRTSRSDAHRL